MKEKNFDKLYRSEFHYNIFAKKVKKCKLWAEEKNSTIRNGTKKLSEKIRDEEGTTERKNTFRRRIN